MAQKKPLYYKKSKATKYLELESEQLLRKHKKGISGKSAYEKESQYNHNIPFDFAYYTDSYDERDLILSSKSSTESSESRSVSEDYYHMEEQERKNNIYNNGFGEQKDLIGKGGSRKRRQQTTIEDKEMFRNGKKFDIYISQQPLALRVENDFDPKATKTKTFAKNKNKKKLYIHSNECELKQGRNEKGAVHHQQQGDSPLVVSSLTESHLSNIKPVLKDNNSNLSENVIHSFLQLRYMPVYVLNNEPLQIKGNMQSALIGSTNVMNDPQNIMSVYTALDLDAGISNAFNGTTLNANNNTEPQTQAIKDEVNTQSPSSLGIKLKKFGANSESAMSVESYETLIRSAPPTHPVRCTFPTIVKSCKAFKKKKNKTQTRDVKEDEGGNGYHPKSSSDISDSEKRNNNNNNTYYKQENGKEKMYDRSSYFNDTKGSVARKNQDNLDNESDIGMETKVDVEDINDNPEIIINVITKKSKEIDLPQSFQSTVNDTGGNIINSTTNSTEINDLPQSFKSTRKSTRENSKSQSITTDPTKVNIQESEILLHYQDQNNNYIPQKQQSLASNRFKEIQPDINYAENCQNICPYKTDSSLPSKIDGKEIFCVVSNHSLPQHFSEHGVNSGYDECIKNPKTPKGILRKKFISTVLDIKDKKRRIRNSGTNSTKNQDIDDLKNIPQYYQDIIHKDLNVDDNPKLQPNSDIFFLEHQISKNPELSKVKDKSLKIIYPPSETNNITSSPNTTSQSQCSQINIQKELLYKSYKDSLLQTAGTVFIISFQVAQYILGATCFDKLINVLHFFFFDDA